VQDHVEGIDLNRHGPRGEQGRLGLANLPHDRERLRENGQCARVIAVESEKPLTPFMDADKY
jgi:hypothetical protein